MNAWSLRPALPRDREFLYSVYASTRAGELEALGWTPQQQATFLRMQFGAQETHYRTHYPDSQFSVIMAGGDAGRLYMDRGEAEIRVLDIALLPAFRRRGLGTAILGALAEEGRSTGRALTLHVERANPALRLYLRLGFVELDEHGLYKLLRHPCAAAPDDSPPRDAFARLALPVTEPGGVS